MSTLTAAPPAAEPRVRAAVGLRDALWVLRRRHRVALWVCLALTVVLAVGLTVVRLRLNGTTACLRQATVNPSCLDRSASRQHTARDWLIALSVAPVLLGAFVGAPMFAREFERGTHILSATSDLPPRRWLRIQIGALLTLAAVLAAVLIPFAAWVHSGLPGVEALRWWWPIWETTWLLVPYAVSACAIGLLFSALLRRTLPAVALTALVVVALRFGAVQILRPHWWPPLRTYSGLDAFPFTPSGGLLLVNDSYADSRGHVVNSLPSQCFVVSSPNPTIAPQPDGAASAVPLTGGSVVVTPPGDVTESCLRAHGITQRVSVYQPASRATAFGLAEGGGFLLIAAGSVLAAARLMRRDPPA